MSRGPDCSQKQQKQRTDICWIGSASLEHSRWVDKDRTDDASSSSSSLAIVDSMRHGTRDDRHDLRTRSARNCAADISLLRFVPQKELALLIRDPKKVRQSVSFACTSLIFNERSR